MVDSSNNFIEKVEIDSNNNRDNFNYVSGLTRNSFVIGEDANSMQILDEKNNEIGHYTLSNIISFDLVDNTIIINSSDQEKIIYVFTSYFDAQVSNDILNDLINGQ